MTDELKNVQRECLGFEFSLILQSILPFVFWFRVYILFISVLTEFGSHYFLFNFKAS